MSPCWKRVRCPRGWAVLEAEKVAIYRLLAGKWRLEQALGIGHARPWARTCGEGWCQQRDHLLDVYLPGVNCRGAGSPLWSGE